MLSCGESASSRWVQTSQQPPPPSRVKGGSSSSSGSSSGLGLMLIVGIVDGNAAGNDGGLVWASQLATMQVAGGANITRQQAGRHGGVLFAGSVGLLRAASAFFYSNVAGLGDGGVAAVSRLSNLTIKGAVFAQNRAWRHGGVLSYGSDYAIARDGASALAATSYWRFEDTALLGNQALNGDGGAMCVQAEQQVGACGTYARRASMS